MLLFIQPEKQLFLLSRCPDNFYKKLAEKVKKQAYVQNAWLPIGKVKDDALHACYEGQEFQETIQIVDAEKNTHALTVRLFVYRSNENTLRIEKRLKKEEERLQADKAVLEKKVFACAEDAESAAREFAGAKHRNLIDIETTVCSKTTETLGRGRIGKNPRPAKTKTLWYVHVRIIGPNEKRVRQAQDNAESFVLITTAPKSNSSQKVTRKGHKLVPAKQSAP
ncbi:hypothetical protein SCACP_28650 [Sporomusa carbonis]|uniref:hypothetical protein n=1 Tax=Sporomusa carbonis TaxID=3076075 RepID=UPI003A71F3F4